MHRYFAIATENFFTITAKKYYLKQIKCKEMIDTKLTLGYSCVMEYKMCYHCIMRSATAH